MTNNIMHVDTLECPYFAHQFKSQTFMKKKKGYAVLWYKKNIILIFLFCNNPLK